MQGSCAQEHHFDITTPRSLSICEPVADTHDIGPHCRNPTVSPFPAFFVSLGIQLFLRPRRTSAFTSALFCDSWFTWVKRFLEYCTHPEFHSALVPKKTLRHLTNAVCAWSHRAHSHCSYVAAITAKSSACGDRGAQFSGTAGRCCCLCSRSRSPRKLRISRSLVSMRSRRTFKR